MEPTKDLFLLLLLGLLCLQNLLDDLLLFNEESTNDSIVWFGFWFWLNKSSLIFKFSIHSIFNLSFSFNWFFIQIYFIFHIHYAIFIQFFTFPWHSMGSEILRKHGWRSFDAWRFQRRRVDEDVEFQPKCLRNLHNELRLQPSFVCARRGVLLGF